MELIAIVVALGGMVWAIFSYRKKQRRLRLMEKRLRLLEKYGDERIVDNIMNNMIWQGMSDTQLIDSWGAPAAKDHKIYKTKISETYKYNQTGRNRFGSRVILENGVVVGWEQR